MLDKKYNAEEKEKKWLDYWKDNKIYEFKRNGKEIYINCFINTLHLLE